ncbi:unnamed protein product, partial [Ectocarpus sp. 8 AP-2014]
GHGRRRRREALNAVGGGAVHRQGPVIAPPSSVLRVYTVSQGRAGEVGAHVVGGARAARGCDAPCAAATARFIGLHSGSTSPCCCCCFCCCCCLRARGLCAACRRSRRGCP